VKDLHDATFAENSTVRVGSDRPLPNLFDYSTGSAVMSRMAAPKEGEGAPVVDAGDSRGVSLAPA